MITCPVSPHCLGWFYKCRRTHIGYGTDHPRRFVGPSTRLRARTGKKSDISGSGVPTHKQNQHLHFHHAHHLLPTHHCVGTLIQPGDNHPAKRFVTTEHEGNES